MNYFQYAVIGFVASTIGALPPGAVNLTVVFETIRYHAANAIPIILAAAIGEVLLSYLVLNFTMPVEAYLQANVWIQYVTALLLLLFGGYFFLKKEIATNLSSPNSRKNRFLKGLFLAVFNPPVWFFWLLAFTIISTMAGHILDPRSGGHILVFMLGVFWGKIFALWLYTRLSSYMASSSSRVTTQLNKGVGLLLIVIGIVQFIKLHLVS